LRGGVSSMQEGVRRRPRSASRCGRRDSTRSTLGHFPGVPGVLLSVCCPDNRCIVTTAPRRLCGVGRRQRQSQRSRGLGCLSSGTSIPADPIAVSRARANIRSCACLRRRRVVRRRLGSTIASKRHLAAGSSSTYGS
jgi:hypothetical protein